MFSMLFLSPCLKFVKCAWLLGCHSSLSQNGVCQHLSLQWCCLRAVLHSPGVCPVTGWLLLTAMDACSACVLGKLVARMSLPSRPQSCFPSALLAISVAFKMPAPGQALGEMCAKHALSVCASQGSQNEDAACTMCSCSQMTHYFWFHQLHLGCVKLQWCCCVKILPFSGAAAVGTDAVFTIPLSVSVHLGPFVTRGCHSSCWLDSPT